MKMILSYLEDEGQLGDRRSWPFGFELRREVDDDSEAARRERRHKIGLPHRPPYIEVKTYGHNGKSGR